MGLVAFAGNAFLQCPLTLDYDAFRQSLDALDTKIIPRGGTDIAAAIHETQAALQGNGNNEHILVLAHRRRRPRRQCARRSPSGGEERLEDFHRRRRQGEW